MRPSQLEGGVIAQINSSWAVAGEARRSRHLPGRRNAWLGRRGPDPLLHPAPGEHAAAGVESRPAADDESSTSSGRKCRTIRSTRTASSCSGKTSSAMWWRTRPGASICGRRQGRAARRTRLAKLGRATLDRRAGSERSAVKRWPPDADPRSAHRRRRARGLSPPQCPAAAARSRQRATALQSRRLFGRACRGRSAGRQRSLARRRTSIGSSTIAFRSYLWDLGPRRGRGHGHGPARHGAELDGRAGADPPFARSRARPARVRWSPAASAPTICRRDADVTRRRRDPRLRGADRGCRGAGRPHHPDGEPRAGPAARDPDGLSSASTTASCGSRSSR